MAAASKRQRRVAPRETDVVETVATVNAVTAVSSILTALRDLEPSPTSSISWRRKLAHDVLDRDCNALTEYGVVCTTGQAPGNNGPVDIYIIAARWLCFPMQPRIRNRSSSYCAAASYLRAALTTSYYI